MHPIITPKTELLIIGNYPSTISIEKQQYYANPSNDFWRVMSLALNQGLELDYEKRINTLLENKIGLWHLQKETIDNVLNDLPMLRTILGEGREAYNELMTLQLNTNIEYLPSTKAINRRISLQEKADIIRQYL